MAGRIRADKPKVLFITRSFPPTLGGMERFAFDINTALNKKIPISTIKWGGLKYWMPIIFPYFLIRGSFELSTKKIDVIHVQDGATSFVGVILKFIFRKPLCVVVHGLDVTFKFKLYQFLIRRSLKYADWIICNSNSTREQVLARRIRPNKVTFIPLGAEDGLFFNDKQKAREYMSSKLGVGKDKKVILYAGRLVKRKGGEWFVKNVLPSLVEKEKNTVFVLSGGGPEKENITKAAETLGLSKNVYVLGRTTDETHHNLFNGADVFVMPNIKVSGDVEGYGIVLLEAALCGLPIVASGIEGIKDAVSNNKNGVLVESGNGQEFIREVQEFLSDSKKSARFGERARKHVINNNNWDAIAGRYIDIYKEIST